MATQADHGDEGAFKGWVNWHDVRTKVVGGVILAAIVGGFGWVWATSVERPDPSASTSASDEARQKLHRLLDDALNEETNNE